MAASSMEAKRLALNMNVLKRHDPSIVEIVDSTSYVVLYRYEPKVGQDGQQEMAWTKTGVEGSMFLYKRSIAPLYGFFILNRHSTENFSDELVDENSLELTPEYIICQSADERIHGIWVFEEDHRDRIGLRMIELCRMSKPSTSLAKAVASVPVPPSNASPVSGTSSKPVPTGQPISLDMLFGNVNDPPSSHQQQQSSSDRFQGESTSFQPPTAPEQAIRKEHPQGMALLDSLFASMPSQSPLQQQVSPVVSERIPDANAFSQRSAGQSDEEDLKRLLGLSTSARAPQPQYAMQESHSPNQDMRNLPPFAQQPPQQYQQSYQQPPFPPPQQQQQQQQMPPFQQRTYEPPFAPQPQRVPQFSAYESPQMQARLPPMQTAPYQPPPMQMQMPPQQQQRVPANNSHFVPAPLMPSVLLNKNRSSATQQSPQTQLQQLPSAPPMVQQPQQQQQQQFYSSSLPTPPQVQRALSPLRQSTTQSQTHSLQQQARLGAQSIPPPPIPPVESRPPDSQVIAQVSSSSPSSAAPGSAGGSQAAGLSSGTAMDLLNEALKRSQIYQAGSSQNGQNPLDRQAFRGQLVGLMQDPRFVEALYQAYLNHMDRGMNGSLI